MKFKRPIAALCYDLINGKTVSIKTGFKDYGITNIPREISRAVEQRFGVRIEREKKDYTTKYGIYQMYFEYKLIRSNQSKESIEKIYAYIEENMIKPEPPKPRSGYSQSQMF